MARDAWRRLVRLETGLDRWLAAVILVVVAYLAGWWVLTL